ncbi:hypothetical protein [Nocardiopsis sp. CC223A]|uniref:hypothetical protein n=1 Tax=Nocardiopsis sp. CC223A TaxID=3044051 RepID=UPI00278C2FC1|nr:hypothetical protein [Nocardiopsis sp. CC223A]
MARTAHHVKAHREGRPLVGLRYARGRPPERVVRRVRVHELARVLFGSPGPEAAVAERRERRRARRAADLARRAVTAAGNLAPDAAEEVVWPPGRHRRGALRSA